MTNWFIRCIDSQHARAAAQEMPCIIVRMKPDKIAMKHSEQNFIPDWQDPINLATGKWSVEEEANLYVTPGCPNFYSKH